MFELPTQPKIEYAPWQMPETVTLTERASEALDIMRQVQDAPATPVMWQLFTRARAQFIEEVI